MDDYVEEDEIKIEYYESFETDPLCEKFGENSFQNHVPLDGVLSSHSKEFCNIEESHSHTCENPLNNDGILQDDYNDHYNSPIRDTQQEEFQTYINEEPSNHTNWYRDIDDSGKFVCKFCDLTYSTIQTIRHHVKTKHPENANALRNIIKNNKRNPKIKCHICKKRFKEMNSLKEHIKEHYSENFLKSCQVCLATFNNDQEMAEHLYQKHQNVPNTKMHLCSICGYRTQKLSHYKQHKTTHLQTKQMKCDSCDYATNYLPNLKIHQRIHTNYKPYSCNNCGYRCSAKSALRSHQLKHNPEENMLYCDKCTYKTVYKNSLKKHIESHKRNSLKLM